MDYKNGIVRRSMLPPAPEEGSAERGPSWTVKMTCFDLMHLEGRNKNMANLCKAHAETVEKGIGVDEMFDEGRRASKTKKRRQDGDRGATLSFQSPVVGD